MRRLSLLIGLCLLAACTTVTNPSTDHPPIRPSDARLSSLSSSTSSSPVSRPSSPPPRNPQLATLNVPFTPQAPFANWDALHEEACEEAALLMVVHSLNGTGIDPDTAEREIQDLVAWETENGYKQDVTAAQMAEIARAKFGLSARVRYDVTENSIKEELAAGNPVVIPAAGRDLGNPYFSGEGPWYHALVIKGFREGWTGRRYFVTNDPGTKRGEGYEYRTDVLLNAIHDWTGVKEQIAEGRKVMLILEKS